jgi:DNA mismatch repair protein MutS2
MALFIKKASEDKLEFDVLMNKINPLSPYGKEAKKEMPIYRKGDECQLVREYDLMEHMEDYYVDRDVITVLTHLKDITESIYRSEIGEVLSVVEIFEIKNFVLLLRRFRKTIKGQEKFEEIKIENLDEVIEWLDPGNEGLNTFYIYDAYSERLSEIRKLKNQIGQSIKDIKKNQKKDVLIKYNLKTNLKGEIYINKSETEKQKLLDDDKTLFISSETPSNLIYSFKNTEKTDQLENDLSRLIYEEEEEEYRVLKRLSGKIGKKSKRFQKNFKSIGKVDLVLAKLREAKVTKATRPEIVEEGIIKILDGRHLKTEESLKTHHQNYTPVSISLMTPLTCITGPNMGGKTVNLKMIGQIALAASYALYVPATSCKMGLLDGIFVSIGDEQSVERGLSTFGAEVRNVSDALARSHERCLILIDELAGGTNPIEGYAITKSIVKYLSDKKSISVITTHFDKVADDRVTKLQVAGLREIDLTRLENELLDRPEDGMAIIAENMDYQLIPTDDVKQAPKDAIRIAELMGMNKVITEYAKELLRGSEQIE